MKKYDIINALGRRYDLRRYLEICTPSTGLTYALVDDELYPTKHRLVYNCPPTDDDGLDYTFRTTKPVTREITDAIANGHTSYDMIFVDPWHTLTSTQTDLTGAWNLLRPGGFIVVHDCNPDRAELTSAEFQIGEWCGVTYQAFVDFVLGRDDLKYFTVDTDYGCGVICKAARLTADAEAAESEELLALSWTLVRNDNDARYAFFDHHRQRLLNLVSVDEFEKILREPRAVNS